MPVRIRAVFGVIAVAVLLLAAAFQFGPHGNAGAPLVITNGYSAVTPPTPTSCPSNTIKVERGGCARIGDRFFNYGTTQGGPHVRAGLKVYFVDTVGKAHLQHRLHLIRSCDQRHPGNPVVGGVEVKIRWAPKRCHIIRM